MIHHKFYEIVIEPWNRGIFESIEHFWWCFCWGICWSCRQNRFSSFWRPEDPIAATIRAWSGTAGSSWELSPNHKQWGLLRPLERKFIRYLLVGFICHGPVFSLRVTRCLDRGLFLFFIQYRAGLWKEWANHSWIIILLSFHLRQAYRRARCMWRSIQPILLWCFLLGQEQVLFGHKSVLFSSFNILAGISATISTYPLDLLRTQVSPPSNCCEPFCECFSHVLKKYWMHVPIRNKHSVSLLLPSPISLPFKVARVASPPCCHLLSILCEQKEFSVYNVA